MVNRVTELYRRSSPDGRYIYCTLPGGMDNQVHWEYFNGELTPEELAPIETVFVECMIPSSDNTWHLNKIGGYSARRLSWREGNISANTPEELGNKIRAYYTRQSI
jgi:hypothetical protein